MRYILFKLALWLLGKATGGYERVVICYKDNREQLEVTLPTGQYYCVVAGNKSTIKFPDNQIDCSMAEYISSV